MAEIARPMIEVTVAAPVDEVWAHLRDPALVRRWFGWEYDGLDAEIRQLFVEQPAVDEDSISGARALRWEYDAEHGDRLEVRPAGGSTLVRATRWMSVDDESWESGHDEIREGWISFVEQLAFAVTRHRGEERHTLFLSAAAAGPDVLPIAATFGLAAVADATVGTLFDVVVAPGDRISGELWFRTRHQLGVTVDQLGTALLVLTETPAAAAPPHGAASMTLNTYGFVPVDDVAGRWSRWWRADVAASPG